jgi:hypothetical protein
MLSIQSLDYDAMSSAVGNSSGKLYIEKGDKRACTKKKLKLARPEATNR